MEVDIHDHEGVVWGDEINFTGRSAAYPGSRGAAAVSIVVFGWCAQNFFIPGGDLVFGEVADDCSGRVEQFLGLI